MSRKMGVLQWFTNVKARFFTIPRPRPRIFSIAVSVNVAQLTGNSIMTRADSNMRLGEERKGAGECR